MSPQSTVPVEPHPTTALYRADRALAVPHREDDQPCGCDECMAYGAEDEGADWYQVTPARRIVLRALDSGDDRLAALATAFREHEAAVTLDAARASQPVTAPDMTAALRVALDRLDAYILATENSDDAIDTDEDRDFIREVREILGPPPVVYPHGYNHRPMCSRTHAVTAPCDETLAAALPVREDEPTGIDVRPELTAWFHESEICEHDDLPTPCEIMADHLLRAFTITPRLTENPDGTFQFESQHFHRLALADRLTHEASHVR